MCELARPLCAWVIAVQVLVYLNNVHDGGETVFPLANGSSSMKTAAAELAAAGVHHSKDRISEPRLQAAAKLLDMQAERAAKGEGGLKVSPTRGAACVFYTLGQEGGIDASSFHFGASVVAPCAGKWTIQFFKELPASARSPAARKEYAKRYHPLATSKGKAATAR
jgi:hypothetical protein